MENQALFSKRNFFFEYLEHTDSKKTEIHYHKCYEIYYLAKGKCRYFIDKKSYLLTAGDLALIPRGVIHKTNYESENHSRFLINCSPAFIPPSVLKHFAAHPHIVRSEEQNAELREDFLAIQREYRSPDEFSEDEVRSLLARILLTVIREAKVASPLQDEVGIAEKAVSYIHGHYSESVSLKEAARLCYVSPEHLSRTFKRETGFGFNEYLNIYRLQRADTLLKEKSHLKISEIALSCGFTDSNYFSKQYKRIYHVSPTEGRKRKEEGDV
ncbi:MAG: helix-turn-helix transcriptional regulator [Clostridia bacterium]|nr:helix-turn-helix transcriptional regulator [Clostridia bacterium]